jgi:hypothetical protein
MSCVLLHLAIGKLKCGLFHFCKLCVPVAIHATSIYSELLSMHSPASQPVAGRSTGKTIASSSAIRMIY